MTFILRHSRIVFIARNIGSWAKPGTHLCYRRLHYLARAHIGKARRDIRGGPACRHRDAPLAIRWPWQLVSGLASHRIGRRPILTACCGLARLTAYPALAWLVAAPSFGRLLTVELWLSLVYGWYTGTMSVWLAEFMPAHVRARSFSFAYNIAAALFGGFTPTISTFLIHETGNAAMGGVWLSMAAAIDLAAALLAKLPTEMRVALRPATLAGPLTLPRP